MAHHKRHSYDGISMMHFHSNNTCANYARGTYTFSIKPKRQTVVFCFFAARSLATAYLRMTAGVPKCCEGFVAIWLHARKEFTDNRFQLLFSATPKNNNIITLLYLIKGSTINRNSYTARPLTLHACSLVRAHPQTRLYSYRSNVHKHSHNLYYHIRCRAVPMTVDWAIV